MTDKKSKDAMGLGRPLDELALELARKPVGVSGKFGRAAQIFQHYQLSQIARRVIRVGQRKMQPNKCVGDWEPSNVQLNHSAQVSELAKIVVANSSQHPCHTRCDVDNGTYVLLNHELQSESRLPTEELLRSQTHLWRFQFHYHEFLLTEVSKGNWDPVVNFLNDWLEAYSPETTKRSEDSWHPYCISRRASVWVWLLVLSSDHDNLLGKDLSKKLLQSLEHQAHYLSENLEWELGGNHLIENATALAIVAGVLESDRASSWLKAATNVLKKEMPAQILPHGEHFERSPMYHCQILGNFLRIKICCEKSQDLQKLVASKIDPMLQFLESILHPDKEIPLLSDSVFHEAPSVQQINEVASIASCSSETISPTSKTRVDDYFVFRSGSTHAICDFGPIAAPNLPAHGHCDVLNLEVSVDGARWIVDSGNFNYSDDSMRHYCRSSLGHNVVTVDNANQADVWSMFRMGRRPQVSNCRSGSDSGWNWASACHDGYAPLGVKRLSRLVAARDESLVCFDFSSSSSNVKGENLVGYLHFHPDVDVGKVESIENGKFGVPIQRSSVKRWLTFVANTVTLEQGWYCEAFGKRVTGTVVRYVTSVSSDFTGWIMQESPNQCEIEFRDQTIGITISDKEKFCWKTENL